MNIAIEYFDMKRIERGIKTHSAFARLVWPEKGPVQGPAYWKRLRSASGYGKAQRLQLVDMHALCSALGLDVAKAAWEIDRLAEERERERESLTPSQK